MERIEYHMIDLKEEMGPRIKNLRRAAGFSSAAAFAESIGINAGKYTHYEQCKAVMPLHIAMQVTEALGISLDELAYGKQETTLNAESFVKRLERLDERALKELEDSLAYIEYKMNRRRQGAVSKPQKETEVSN